MMKESFDKGVKETTRSGKSLEHSEFKKGRGGFEVCKICHSIYHKKSWHHSVVGFKGGDSDHSLKFVLCPACKMIKNGLYEGKIVIKKVPQHFHLELVNLIKNNSHKAFLQDPMDRLIEIKKTGNDFVVTTTENQIAVRLAKKIKDAFNTVNIEIKYFGEVNDGDLVTIIFKQN